MKTVLVTAAVIERDGVFLVARRQPGVHLAGYWEFPGGKCETGEPLLACLKRELHEELGVEAIGGDELFSTTHEYEDRRVELHFIRCDLVGEPAAQVGQQLRWVTREEMKKLPFPPADTEFIRILTTKSS